MKLKGLEAIAAKAANYAVRLDKYNDPTEDAHEDLSIEQAMEVAGEDPNLIHCEASVAWTRGDGTGIEGYNLADYIDGSGRYLGPDEHGIEPIVTV